MYGILGHLLSSAILEGEKEQEAHGPWSALLSEIDIADMQMLCNFFPILSLQQMKESSFEQFLVLKKRNVILLLLFFFTIYGHNNQWSMTI